MMHVLKGNIDTDVVTLDEKTLDHIDSLQYANHSPTGFSWGYGGSGPAQLSLAILLKLIPPQQALALYMDFKWEFIVPLPFESSFCLELDIESWVQEQLKKPEVQRRMELQSLMIP